MTLRTPLIAGNWKMHRLPSEANTWLAALLERLRAAPVKGADLALLVPFTHLPGMARLAFGEPVAIGAQDVSRHSQGAYTGEVSAAMLKDAGARYAIAGHSERRAHHAESDELVGAKARAAAGAGLTPILCVGESREQREAGQAESVVLSQLTTALSNFTPNGSDSLVIAYEPVWAIGTGLNATPDDAQAMCASIRERLRGLYPELADGIRVLYGGSMKPSNAAELLALPDVDGGLIGGASLEIDDYLGTAAQTGRHA